MNKRIKLLPILLVMLMLGVMFTFSAYATDEPGADTPAVSTPVTPEPSPEPPPEPEPEPPVTSDPVTSDPVTPETPVTSDPVTPETPVTSDPVSSVPSGGYVDSYTNEDGSYYYDEDTMVNNISDYAGNVSDYTTLYDTSDFDDSTLKETKWDDITIDTSKTKKDTDAMDFSAIKENKATEDDGQWILYTGYALIGISMCGILYYIIATSTYKKKLKALARRESAQRSYRASQRSRDDYGDYASEYPTQRDYNQRYRNSSRRYTTDNRSYSERKRMKADTAEINLR